jgi:hypothetical protein
MEETQHQLTSPEGRTTAQFEVNTRSQGFNKGCVRGSKDLEEIQHQQLQTTENNLEKGEVIE